MPRLVAGVGGLLVVALAVVMHRSVRVLDIIRAKQRRQRAAHDGRVEHVAELRDLGEHEPRVPLRLDLVLVDPVVARLPQLRVPLGGEVRDGEPGQCSTIRRRGIVSLEPKTERNSDGKAWLGASTANHRSGTIGAGSMDHERTR